MSSKRAFSRKAGAAVVDEMRREERCIVPKPLKSNIVYNHRYRFVSTSGTLTSITNNSILLAAGCFTASTNAVVASIAGSYRIRFVEMWCPPSAQGGSATCSIEWIGSTNGTNNLEVSDTTVSVARPAHVMSVPPRLSLASFWTLGTVSSSPITEFSLIAPVGTIIDVGLDLIMNDDDVGTTGTVTTAASGATYYLSLDPNATHRYTPVSLSTTT
jgi:hypothetical protein